MTKEELLALIETKVAQQGNQGASELAEILKEIVTNGIAPTAIDLSTLESGQTYTAKQLAEIGLTQEAMEAIANSGNFSFGSTTINRLGVMQCYFTKGTGDFKLVLGGVTKITTGSAAEYNIITIYGDKTNGYDYTVQTNA